MPKRFLPAMLFLLASACAPTSQDRARDFTDDGLHLYRKGSYAVARDSFQAALALRPDDPDLLFNLGRCAERLSQQEEAERLYRACLKQRADHDDARYGLCMLLAKGGRRSEAVAMVEEWLRTQPKSASPYVADGWLRAQDGDVISARARFQQALDLEPRHAQALVELAAVYERLNRADRALVLYQRSLGVDPDQPEVRKKAEALRKQGTQSPMPD